MVTKYLMVEKQIPTFQSQSFFFGFFWKKKIQNQKKDKNKCPKMKNPKNFSLKIQKKTFK